MGFAGKNPLPTTGDPTLCVAPFERTGSSPVTKESNTGPNNQFTLYRPTTLVANHPIVTWGNGTYATPVAYDGLLRHFASHGFVVIASNSTQTGSGREMLEGAKWLANQNSVSGSRFFARLDSSAICATGHSQGGGGTLNAGADPVITCTAPIQPSYSAAASRQRGPMFLLAGSNDTIITPANVTRTFNASNVETVYGTLTGASHFEPVGSGGRMKGYLTAWFALQLQNSALARDVFTSSNCGIKADTRWVTRTK